jgi:hypothetical protein
MPRVKEITFHQIRNTGRYENKQLSVTVEVDEGEDPVQAMLAAQVFVKFGLYPESNLTERHQSLVATAMNLPPDWCVLTGVAVPERGGQGA